MRSVLAPASAVLGLCLGGGAEAQQFNWMGLYVGGHGSYVAGSATIEDATRSFKPSGGVGGVHAGFNWQSGQLLLGVEGDVGFGRTTDRLAASYSLAGLSASASAELESSLLASVRGRMGIVTGPALIFATAGIAFTDTRLRLDASATSGGASLAYRWTYDDRAVGFVVGGGVEVKLTSALSGRIEGLYHGFRDAEIEIEGHKIGYDHNVGVVRLGLTYHFN